MKRIGVVVGREWSWPPAFLEEVNRRDAGVMAEFPVFDILRAGQAPQYDVLIDRISHEVPFYRGVVKAAAASGTVVINNPFMWSADDKFFGGSLLTALGIAQPRTVLLPNFELPDAGVGMTDGGAAIRWQDVGDYVGFPAILKDAHGGGGRAVWRVENADDLRQRFTETGRLTVIVQELITWDHYVRCLCIGQEHILPIKYDPRASRYFVDHAHMSPELGATVVDWAQRICRALGYDMNTVEFAVCDGVPIALDFMNPAPDFDIYSLTPFYFQWAVTRMADLAIERALHGPRPAPPSAGARATAGSWANLFAGERPAPLVHLGTPS